MDRRKFLTGAAALFCAPAIVKAESIMRINPDLYAPPAWTVDYLPEGPAIDAPLLGSVDVYVSDFHTTPLMQRDIIDQIDGVSENARVSING